MVLSVTAIALFLRCVKMASTLWEFCQNIGQEKKHIGFRFRRLNHYFRQKLGEAMYRERLKPLVRVVNWMFSLVSVLVVVSLIIEYGFYPSVEMRFILHRVNMFILWFFIVQYFIRLLAAREPFVFIRVRWFESILIAFIMGEILFMGYRMGWDRFNQFLFGGEIFDLTRVYIVLLQLSVLSTLIIEAVRINRRIARLKMHPAQILMGSFLLIILFGTGLLMLPRAVTPGNHLSFLDALFTATSATCVTGLIVVDTGSFFSPLGQGIILFLIQVGGVGIMTFSSFFALLLRRNISLRESAMLGNILNVEYQGLIREVLLYTIMFTFAFELLGTLFLFIGFLFQSFPFTDAIYAAVFHSISAFCNAGFSIFSDSLMGFSQNYWVLGTVMILIVFGGLGFPVLMNLSGFRLRPLSGKHPLHRFTVQTRIVLLLSLGLILGGTLIYLLLEWNATLRGLSPLNKVVHALFQSITTRTAGFNTQDIGQIQIPTILIFIALMFVGASPGSTGGGIKTTTIAVLFARVVTVIRGREHTHLFHKKIHDGVINRALVVFMASLGFIMLAIFILTLTEEHTFVDIVFEVVSAFGTVGLSRGITPELSAMGKVVIILAMFLGRLGVLPISLALAGPVKPAHFDYPAENVMVG